jgi:hypothetical protein
MVDALEMAALVKTFFMCLVVDALLMLFRHSFDR